MKCKYTLLVIWLIISACAPKVPIPVLEYGKMDASENRNLLILLRGRGGSHRDFAKHGIIDEVRKRNLPFDIVAPAADFGYYRTETLPERLKHDIIDPARAKGYKNIWLAGFSMGGLGSLFTIRSYPKAVDGVILISPFLGWSSILEEIETTGGVSYWFLPVDKSHKWQYTIWGWIKEYQADKDQYPEIYLGFGDNDSMTGEGPALLSQALGPGKHFSVPGNHNYKTFKVIWRQQMDRLEGKFLALR